jgi:hypothetical protein
MHCVTEQTTPHVFTAWDYSFSKGFILILSSLHVDSLFGQTAREDYGVLSP